MGDRLICARCGTEAVNGSCPSCPARGGLTQEVLNRLRKGAEGAHHAEGFTEYVNPDIALDLLDEISRLRAEDVRLRAIAYRALGREVTDDDDGLVECWSCTVDRYAGVGPCRHCGAAASPTEENP